METLTIMRKKRVTTRYIKLLQMFRHKNISFFQGQHLHHLLLPHAVTLYPLVHHQHDPCGHLWIEGHGVGEDYGHLGQDCLRPLALGQELNTPTSKPLS